MAVLVDYTYYKGSINIDTSKQSVKERLFEYSNLIEEKYLKKLLGNNTYYDYVANKAAEKYVNLLKKATFNSGSETYENDIVQMLAYFVYFHFISDDMGKNTPTGEIVPNVETGVIGYNHSKICNAYNKGVDLFNVAIIYLSEQSANFPNASPIQLYKINSFGI